MGRPWAAYDYRDYGRSYPRAVTTDSCTRWRSVRSSPTPCSPRRRADRRQPPQPHADALHRRLAAGRGARRRLGPAPAPRARARAPARHRRLAVQRGTTSWRPGSPRTTVVPILLDLDDARRGSRPAADEAAARGRRGASRGCSSGGSHRTRPSTTSSRRSPRTAASTTRTLGCTSSAAGARTLRPHPASASSHALGLDDAVDARRRRLEPGSTRRVLPRGRRLRRRAASTRASAYRCSKRCTTASRSSRSPPTAVPETARRRGTPARRQGPVHRRGRGRPGRRRSRRCASRLIDAGARRGSATSTSAAPVPSSSTRSRRERGVGVKLAVVSPRATAPTSPAGPRPRPVCSRRELAARTDCHGRGRSPRARSTRDRGPTTIRAGTTDDRRGDRAPLPRRRGRARADFDARHGSRRAAAAPRHRSRTTRVGREPGPGLPGADRRDRARATPTSFAFHPYLYHPTVAGLPRVAGRASCTRPRTTRRRSALPLYRDDLRSARPDSPTGATPSSDSSNGASRWRPDAGDRRRARRRRAARRRRGRTRARVGLDDRPFLLCLGRVDDGKGARLLAECFAQYKERRAGPLALVFAGPVVNAPPAHPDIIVTGAVDEDVKWGLLRAAQALVSPSAFESFSIVLLEAWTVGTPAFVNSRCEVTRRPRAPFGRGSRVRFVCRVRGRVRTAARVRNDPRHDGRRGSRLRRGALPLAGSRRSLRRLPRRDR